MELGKIGLNIAQKTPKRVDRNFFIFTATPLTLLLITLGLGALVAYPKYTDLPNKKDEISRLTEKDSNLANKIKQINDLVDFKEIIEEDLRLVNTAMPSEENIPLLLTQVQLIAKGSGLSITNLTYSPSSPSSTGPKNVVNAQLSVKGTYFQLLSFLKTLEKASRIIDISTVRITTGEGRGTSSGVLSGGELDIALGLSSAFQPADSQAAVESPISVNVRSAEFTTLINKLKEFKVYETTVDATNIGKDNPFNQ